ncbi:SsgA family sporulation/cell division regulator [Streptomyces orinoci]|uniref:SsgA family sporulation/cell division regulator n=1 Tax=Streptomyces orinoci TaxID=67339 RepID=A0ABV3K7U2_STRON|nr:SsgA family sporulation/cell division regulator [Streptomyces orinoci]
MHTVLEEELETELVLSPEHGIPLAARVSYRTDDPYAVRFTFHLGDGTPVDWTFARELLMEGVRRPCGQGDVRVWPMLSRGRAVACVALVSPDGEALLRVPLRKLREWLDRTLQVVPEGQEGQWLGLDEALRVLLAPAAGEEGAP